MYKIKVLIVDDSAFSRQSLRTLLESSNEFEVIGIARDGEEAIEKVNRIKPDVVTMDIEMKKMSGIEALKVLMKDRPIPVVMVSDYVAKGEKNVIEALQNGAVECFLKGDILGSQAKPRSIQIFFERLKQAVGVNLELIKPKPISQKIEVPKSTPVPMYSVQNEFQMVFIGCSTGGPNALREILPKFPSTFKLPILVAQHMPKGFTASLAKSFNKTCQLPVREVKNGDKVEGGVVYIAPSGFQTILQKKGTDVVFVIEENNKYKAAYTPCVDVTLNSLVSIYKNKLLTLIMTGMGHDGLEGCRKAKKSGGYIVTQSKESCVVYGMPRSVDEEGLSNEKADLYSLYDRVMHLTGMDKG